ncbi:hypothetical protein CEXT_643641 [Caerostris extrusa]|uniref:Uncharacterized protein n=1 Tax=Caerostris extrusa TaxID=172846 RepID=A0AAV4XJ15_CAEEX|nr:hypothetical protein CEXT_643641 [Caerostris extrusa]
MFDEENPLTEVYFGAYDRNDEDGSCEFCECWKEFWNCGTQERLFQVCFALSYYFTFLILMLIHLAKYKTNGIVDGESEISLTAWIVLGVGVSISFAVRLYAIKRSYLDRIRQKWRFIKLLWRQQ